MVADPFEAMSQRNKKSLFISYDGATEPLSYSQVIPYLCGLSRQGIEIDLITYNKHEYRQEREEMERVGRIFKEHGISWHPLRYHKRPKVLSTFYDIARGILLGAWLIALRRVRIVHARSYVAGFMAAVLKKIFGVRFIFDMRGLWVDERVDGGLWPSNGILFRGSKRIERWMISRSDHIVVLTEAMKRYLEELPNPGGRGRAPITVIRTCADLERFPRAAEEGLERPEELRDKFVLVSSGALAGWKLFGEMLDFFSVLKEEIPSAHFLILTHMDHRMIESEMRVRRIGPEYYTIRRVHYREVSRWLSWGDAAVCFYRQCFSSIGTCPTKLGEFLSVGLPIVINTGIGDCDEIVGRTETGVMVEDFSASGYRDAIHRLSRLLEDREGLSERCRRAAGELFDLRKGVGRYREIYRRLADRVLYISYDGATEPLGQSQILGYLKPLSGQGLRFSLVTFDKKEYLLVRGEVQRIRDDLEAKGINWHSFRYHKKPSRLGTFWDICVGVFVGGTLILREGITILHARSYVSAMIAYILSRVFSVRFIFDMRGLWADERVDYRVWPEKGGLYRISKRLENAFLRAADHVVVLTDRMRTYLLSKEDLGGRKMKIDVIPTCVDTAMFGNGGFSDVSLNPLRDRFVFVYTGSLGEWFLLNPMLDFFMCARDAIPGAHFLILTHGEHRAVRSLMEHRGILSEEVTIHRADFGDMPGYLELADAALFFLKRAYCSIGTCPTKFAEFLAAGIPVIVNSGIGDMEEIIRSEKVGLLVDDFTQGEYRRVLSDLVRLREDRGIGERCRQTASTRFSLNLGVMKYRDVYGAVGYELP